MFGVPQGSILGPLLILFYLQNMSFNFKQIPQKIFCLYADDAGLKVSSESLDELEMLSFIKLSNINKFLNEHYL